MRKIYVFFLLLFSAAYIAVGQGSSAGSNTKRAAANSDKQEKNEDKYQEAYKSLYKKATDFLKNYIEADLPLKKTGEKIPYHTPTADEIKKAMDIKRRVEWARIYADSMNYLERKFRGLGLVVYADTLKTLSVKISGVIDGLSALQYGNTAKGVDPMAIDRNYPAMGLYNQSDFFRHQSSILPKLQCWTTDPSGAFYSEARYGYEAIYTGSLYVGCNLSRLASKMTLSPDSNCWWLYHYTDLVLMIGGISGQINGLSFAAIIDINICNHVYLKSENEYVPSSSSITNTPYYCFDKSRLLFSFGNPYKAQYSVGVGLQNGTECLPNSGNTIFFHYVGPMMRVEILRSIAFEIYDYWDQYDNRWVYTAGIELMKDRKKSK